MAKYRAPLKSLAFLRRVPPLNKLVGALKLVANRRSFIQRSGWLRSYATGTSVGPEGQPVPWYTYSAVDFLDSRDLSALDVFEYGSGNSTLWWAARCREISSVEHDLGWYEIVQPSLPAGTQYQHIDVDSGEYHLAADRWATTPNLIVVDGQLRNQCIDIAIKCISPQGVIVLDNAEREEYADGRSALADAGFREVAFVGQGPINTTEWTTSIFYRDNNVLGM